jgi:hypothetical protein
MRSLAVSLLFALAACSYQGAGPEPSLAPRAAEAIDPHVPIPSQVPSGPADSSLVQRLEELVAAAREGAPAFEARAAEASRLAAAAGPASSESWVAAQQALSRLVEQYGVTTRAAADIDALASAQLEGKRWIAPADQEAIAAAAAAVAAISQAQADTLARLREALAG